MYYLTCDKIEIKGPSTYDYKVKKYKLKEFDNRSYVTLNNCIKQLRQLGSESYFTNPWESFVDQGLELLHAQESDFHRPAQNTDRLFAFIGGNRVQVEHPTPRSNQSDGKSGRSIRVHYGPIASRHFFEKDHNARAQFCQQHGVCAFDGGIHPFLDVLESSRHSIMIIRGISDYDFGQTLKQWQPYAALCAAAYMKALVNFLPSNKSKGQ